jgi:hypothetical protein
MATDTSAVAAVAAATAAAVAARGVEGTVVKQRRLSDEGSSAFSSSTGGTGFGGTGGATFSSTSGSTGRTAVGASQLSRLDSKSTPLPDRLQVYRPDVPPVSPSSASSSYAVHAPSSPRSDISSSTVDSGTDGTASTGGTAVHTSKRVRITKVLHRISRRSEEPRVEDADAPPSEVVEHNKQAQQQEEQGGKKELREMQKELTPGETGRGLAGDMMKEIYRWMGSGFCRGGGGCDSAAEQHGGTMWLLGSGMPLPGVPA